MSCNTVESFANLAFTKDGEIQVTDGAFDKDEILVKLIIFANRRLVNVSSQKISGDLNGFLHALLTERTADNATRIIAIEGYIKKYFVEYENILKRVPSLK